jgi:hypothetical protein
MREYVRLENTSYFEDASDNEHSSDASDQESASVESQTITVEEDFVIFIQGRKSSSRIYFYYLICFISLGLGFLIMEWNKKLYVGLTTNVSCFLEADSVLICNDNSSELVLLKTHHLPKTKLSTVFKKTKSNKNLRKVRYFEYKYFDFLLNPKTKTFIPLFTYTSNPASIKSILTQTLNTPKIFKKNEIKIIKKNNWKLLLDEVIHPFFVFQIFSIVLWSLDDYFVYAGTIAVISIASTYMQFKATKKNIDRMQQLITPSVTVWKLIFDNQNPQAGLQVDNPLKLAFDNQNLDNQMDRGSGLQVDNPLKLAFVNQSHAQVGSSNLIGAKNTRVSAGGRWVRVDSSDLIPGTFT